MTPHTLAKSGSEHAHQVAFFAYCAVAHKFGFACADIWAATGTLPLWEKDHAPALPALEWIHAIPNGGARADDARGNAIRGAALKAEGVRPGVADIFLPYPAGCFAGLYIEMKKPTEKPKREGSKGGLSDNQIAFAEYVKRVRYSWIVCYSWEEAARAVRNYLEHAQ